jgi:hypothetical protein
LDGIVDKRSRWKQKSLNVLADALSYLDPKERRFLKGIKFVRDAVGQSESQAGLYRFQELDGIIEQSITIYDNAFNGMRHTFCGPIKDPKSAAHIVMIHEMGHLIANQPIVDFDRRYNAIINVYNQKVSQYNNQNTAALEMDIEELGSRLQVMQKNPVRRPGPIIEAFGTHRTFDKGPTEYSNESPQEAFAESYALFKLDPEALERIDPNLYQWFASGAYLDLLPSD